MWGLFSYDDRLLGDFSCGEPKDVGTGLQVEGKGDVLLSLRVLAQICLINGFSVYGADLDGYLFFFLLVEAHVDAFAEGVGIDVEAALCW